MTNMEMTKWERARRDNSKLLDIKYFTQCLGKIHLKLPSEKQLLNLYFYV